jgi:unsaturated rhamnogalacturonyl hydrolase
VTDHLSELVSRVAEQTVALDMENETWQKAVALNGLVATGEDRFVEAAQRLVDRSIETQIDTGQLSYGSLDPKEWADELHYQSQTDPAALARPALEFYERTGEERYLGGARGEYEFLTSRAQRTKERGIAHHRGTIELWVDSIYMICPILARYGAVAGGDAAFDEAAHQIEIQANYLQDPHTDLFRHQWRETPNSYPQGTFWSRGNGWALAGILDTLEHLPDDHSGRDTLLDIFRDLAAVVIDYQDRSGYWHNILDDPQSPLETSGTLMFAYAFSKGVHEGILDADPYMDAAERGMKVCRGAVDDEGRVRRVVGPPGGPNVPFKVTSYGQGWFLLAASKFQ